jgi:hypothetical protein
LRPRIASGLYLRRVGDVLRLIKSGGDAPACRAIRASEYEGSENSHDNEQIADRRSAPAGQDCGCGGGRHMTEMPVEGLNFR